MSKLPIYARSLTIWEAAYWMKIGRDPHEAEARFKKDADYLNYFNDHPGGNMAVLRMCEVIESAMRVRKIRATKKVLLRDADYEELDFTRTRINKADWLEFCRHNEFSELAERLEAGGAT